VGVGVEGEDRRTPRDIGQRTLPSALSVAGHTISSRFKSSGERVILGVLTKQPVVRDRKTAAPEISRFWGRFVFRLQSGMLIIIPQSASVNKFF